MADRLQYNPPSLFTDRAADINYDDGTADYMRGLSGAFLDVAKKAHQVELRRNVDQAKKDGILAGSQQGVAFKPVKSQSLVHKVYNDAGVEAATVKMTLRTNEAIQRIALANPGNPDAQRAAMEKWRESYGSDLPDEMLTAFQQNFDQLAMTQLTAAYKQLGEIQQSEAKNTFLDYESAIGNSVEMFAPNMFQPGEVGTEAAKSIEMLRKNYIQLLAKNGPGVEYTVGGYKIPQGSGRSGAFTVEEIGKKVREFDKKITGAAVKGDFLKELEAGRGVAAYFNFVDGNTAITTVDQNGEITQLPIDKVFEMEDKETIAAFMRTHISTLNSFEEASDRQAENARKDYNRGFMDRALVSGFNVQKQADGSEVLVGNPDALRMAYLEAANDDSGMIDLKTVTDLKSLMETVGTGDLADPSIVSKTRLAVINREITAASQLPENGLGDEARGELVKLTRDINAGQHWSNSNRYQSMLRLGKASLAPEAATGFTMFGDPGKESAADYAEYEERLMLEILGAEKSGALPKDINAAPGKDEFDIETRAQAIIKDIRDRKAAAAKDPEIEAIDKKIAEMNSKIEDDKSSNDEMKKARDELKKLMDEKARLQTKRQFNFK